MAALSCADAADELTHVRLPGTAGVTMLEVAADLLVAGEEIASAAGHRQWPMLEGEW
ncbi:MAG: hypothetical protein ACREQ5_29920 [Candidatus Dormibacteria bacterium]